MWLFSQLPATVTMPTVCCLASPPYWMLNLLEPKAKIKSFVHQLLLVMVSYQRNREVANICIHTWMDLDHTLLNIQHHRQAKQSRRAGVTCAKSKDIMLLWLLREWEFLISLSAVLDSRLVHIVFICCQPELNLLAVFPTDCLEPAVFGILSMFNHWGHFSFQRTSLRLYGRSWAACVSYFIGFHFCFCVLLLSCLLLFIFLSVVSCLFLAFLLSW